MKPVSEFKSHEDWEKFTHDVLVFGQAASRSTPEGLEHVPYEEWQNLKTSDSEPQVSTAHHPPEQVD